MLVARRSPMGPFRIMLSSLIVSASLFAMTSCENEPVGSSLVEFGAASGGIILGVATANCVDLKTYGQGGTLTRSVAAPALYIPGLSITWLSTTQNLQLAQVKITVRSPMIAGGTVTKALDIAELEAMFGAEAGIIKAATGVPSQNIYYSMNTGKTNGASACGLATGPFTLKNPDSTTPFTAQVRLDLLGLASDTVNGANPQTIRKSVTTSAEFQ